MKEIINYTLAFLMWLVIGRALLYFLLSNVFFVADPKKNPVYLFFCKFTDWLYRPLGFLPCCKTLAIVLILFCARVIVVKYL